jgi:hypothetical protein
MNGKLPKISGTIRASITKLPTKIDSVLGEETLEK